MVEKVARAICVSQGGHPDDWRNDVVHAIAAIKAMRDCTDDMLDASWKQTGESKEMRSRTHCHYRRHYQAMIDAALGEHK